MKTLLVFIFLFFSGSAWNDGRPTAGDGQRDRWGGRAIGPDSESGSTPVKIGKIRDQMCKFEDKYSPFRDPNA